MATWDKIINAEPSKLVHSDSLLNAGAVVFHVHVFPLQSLAIMNDLKEKNDWNYALRHVPSRKIMSRDGSGGQNEEKLEKMSNQMSAKTIREQYRRNVVYDLLVETP